MEIQGHALIPRPFDGHLILRVFLARQLESKWKVSERKIQGPGSPPSRWEDRRFQSNISCVSARANTRSRITDLEEY